MLLQLGRRSGHRYAVLHTDDDWVSRLGPDDRLRKDDVCHADDVLGVMPREFRFPTSEADIWRPMAFPEEMFQDRANNFVTGAARLKPGVTPERAGAELNASIVIDALRGFDPNPAAPFLRAEPGAVW